MDLWLNAATAATEYVTKHLQNVSKGKEKFRESSSEDLSNVKVESPRSVVRGKTLKEGNFGDCLNGERLDMYEYGDGYGVEVSSVNEESLGNNDEVVLDSFGDRAFVRGHRRYGSLIKPFYMENGVMSRLHREKVSVEDYLRSPFPSPCGSVLRPLIVSDGTKVTSRNTGECISQKVPNFRIPQLRKLESSVLFVKRRDGIAKSASRRSDHGIGSNDATLLLCVGISIGIMSSIVANKTIANKVKEALKQTENLVNHSEDELKSKDSLTVNDVLHNDENECDEQRAEIESISNIEAELEAELERLEICINSPDIELEPDFEVDFAQGELRDDLVKRQHSDETDSNQEPSGNLTPLSGNYTVSPRELSLRLHKVINSRHEERIKELEIALEESQRKVEQLVMESAEKKKPLSRLWETHEVMRYKRDSNLPVSVAQTEKKHDNPVKIQPLVMNLGGEALNAFNESYDELMDINHYSEDDDIPFEIHENEQQEELSLTSKSSPWSHKHYTKDSSRTSEDINFSALQGLLGLSDEEEEEEFESEMEKQLIKQIVEKTKQGSPAVLNAQKMLFLMEEIEQNI